MNPEIKDRIMTKYLGVFEFRHDVPAFLPDIPFTDPSHLKEGREQYDAQWNEGALELFIDELINGGIEEDMQYLLANSFDNVTQIKTSNREYPTLDSGNQYDADPTNFGYTQSIIADMDANDTVYMRFYQGGGTAQADLRTESYWTGALLC